MHTFKTQVLLLHSQQSTLDRFSASLGDEYSVHLATSGTEALNTLGLTPIHVMISAQKLPGMSGIEALREARKRSPETLGILIAPEDMPAPEVEALVGKDEVFQVIRGLSSPQEMRRIVDEAVHQMKMTALQSSANDQSAGPRTGSYPVNKPKPPAPPPERPPAPIPPRPNPAAARRRPPAKPAPPAQETRSRLVVLTKDDLFLDTVHQAVAAHYAITHVDNLRDAGKIIGGGVSGVLITDAAVAPKEVQAITARLRKKQPRLVTIVAGRRDDGDKLMDLIQGGIVYRFLLKPVSPGRAKLAIDAAVRRFAEEAPGPVAPTPTATPPAPQKPPARSVGPQPAAAPRPAPAPVPKARVEPTLADFEDAEEIILTGDEPARVSTPQKRTRTESDAAPVSPPMELSLEPASGGLRLWHILIGVGAALAVGAGWLLFGGETPPAETPTLREGSPPPPEPVVSRTLLDAREAAAEGRLLESGSGGALPLYAAALAEDPGNREIVAEADAVVAEAMGAARAMLADGDPDGADGARALIGASFPAAPGLGELATAIADVRRDTLLQRARDEAAAGQVDAALATLDSAASLDPVPDLAVLSAREEILAAVETRGRTLLLELGNQRLLQGQLVEPPQDNARYYYRAVLAQDSESIAGRQGMAFLRTALITRIRESVEVGDRRAAEVWLRQAQLSGVEAERLAQFEDAVARLPEAPSAPPAAPADDETASAEPAESDTMDDGVEPPVATDPPAGSRAADDRAASAQTAATESADDARPASDSVAGPAASALPEPEPVPADENVAEAPSAEDAAAAARTAAEPAADVPESAGPVVSGDPAPEPVVAEAAVEAPATGESAAGTLPAEEPGTPEPAPVAAAESAPVEPEAAAQEPTASEDRSASLDRLADVLARARPAEPPAAASSEKPEASEEETAAEKPRATLRRLDYVAPEYPRVAGLRRQEGWVDVEFSVTADGSTAAVVVADADPRQVFDRAAIEAVEKWRYEDPQAAGWPLDERMRVRINFTLNP